MMKTMLVLTSDEGEQVLLDVDEMLVVEPVIERQDDGTYSNRTLITFKRGQERTVRESFAQVMQRLTTAARVSSEQG